ncbi:MAG TPA: YezD family protein [Chthoniobacterales bacterium]
MSTATISNNNHHTPTEPARFPTDVFSSSPSSKTGRDQTPWLAIVEEKVNQIRFGVIQIVVHESRVVQIEKTEKIRLH